MRGPAKLYTKAGRVFEPRRDGLMNRTGVVVCLVAWIAGFMMLPTASANCSPAKQFTTWDFTPGATVYYYVYNFESEDTSNVIGAFWEPGSRAQDNEGTTPVDDYLRFYTGYPESWYISGNLGDSRVNGCPTGELVLAGGQNIVMQVFGTSYDEYLMVGIYLAILYHVIFLIWTIPQAIFVNKVDYL